MRGSRSVVSVMFHVNTCIMYAIEGGALVGEAGWDEIVHVTSQLQEKDSIIN